MLLATRPSRLCSPEGTTVGDDVGSVVGVAVGTVDGTGVGRAVGIVDGLAEGHPVRSVWRTGVSRQGK